MAQQQKGLEKLQETLRDHVLVHLQSPLVLRIVVISLIGMTGIGGMGTPLYFKLQTLYERYYEQQVRVVLIKEHQDVKLIFAEYKQRLSSNTEFIEWVRDIRDACRQGDLTIVGLQPTLVGSKDPDAVRQLTIELTVTGTYLNIIRVLGRFEYSKVRINVREIKMAPSASGNFLVRLKLGILMQPPSAKKSAKEKVAVAQTAVAISTAIASATSTVTNISTAAVPSATSAVAPAVSTAPVPSPKAKPAVPPAPPKLPAKEPAVSSATAAGTPPALKAPQTQPAQPQLPPTPSSKFRTDAAPQGATGSASPSSKFSTQNQPQTAAPSSKFAPPEPAPLPQKRTKAPRTAPPQTKATVIQPKANPDPELEGDGGLLPE